MMRTVANVARRTGVRSTGHLVAQEIPAKLPDLPYDFNALEPVISADIMKLHWDKHHRAYVNNFNTAVEKLDGAVKKGDVPTVVNLQSAIKFNGGGHVNHSIFWQNLAPPKSVGGGQPDGELLKNIEENFGSFEKFVETMNAQTAAIQGSGWGWLGFNSTTGNVQIATCPNQDSLELTTGLKPLLGIDIWEHAFYLQYKNDKVSYLKEIWKVINWKDVQHRFDAARGNAGACSTKK